MTPSPYLPTLLLIMLKMSISLMDKPEPVVPRLTRKSVMLRSEKLSQSIPLPDHNYDVIVGQPFNKVRVIYTPLPEQSRLTIGIFRRNEYIPYGNDLVPYENAFIPRGNELIPTSCWNLHKPKLPKIKTF